MTPETFFENFALLADAPNGVQKLRELVLQLAVQGKLVPQDPNDEPASVLLEKIETERAQKNQVGKTKRSPNAPPLRGNAIPFELREGWKWARFSDVATVATNLVHPDRYLDLPHVAPDNIEKSTGRLLEYRTVREDRVQSGNHRFFEGQILYSKIRPNLAKATIVDFDGLCSADMYPIEAHIDPSYLLKYMLSPTFLSIAVRNDTRVAMPKINQNDLNMIPVPVPPLAEQHRIVAKVDQLMTLCDELEARQQKRNESRLQLNNALIGKLLAAREPDEFAEHWQRICSHFDLLYDTPGTIGQLRQAILQLAVQGKLVLQDPNDEPASVLLEKIKAEKERWAKEGRAKKSSPSLPVKGDEAPFELPQGWKWGRLGDLTLYIESGWSPACEKRPRSGHEWGVLKVSAVSWGTFDPNENKALPSHLKPRLNCEVKAGDFLMSRANTSELIGKSVIVRNSPPHLMLSDKILRVVFFPLTDCEFVNYFNNSGFARRYYAAKGSGTSASMRNISRDQIQEMPIPIPPISEQHRIVAKVDQLMALCDQLETKLKQSQADSEKLMGAMVHHLLAA